MVNHNIRCEPVEGLSDQFYWRRVRLLRNDSVVYTLMRKGYETISTKGILGKQEDVPLVLIVNKTYFGGDRWFICDLEYNPLCLGHRSIVMPLKMAKRMVVDLHNLGVTRYGGING